jgi:hypothetical protein
LGKKKYLYETIFDISPNPAISLFCPEGTMWFFQLDWSTVSANGKAGYLSALLSLCQAGQKRRVRNLTSVGRRMDLVTEDGEADYYTGEDVDSDQAAKRNISGT